MYVFLESQWFIEQTDNIFFYECRLVSLLLDVCTCKFFGAKSARSSNEEHHHKFKLKLSNCWRQRTLRWNLLFLQDFQISGHLLIFFYKLKCSLHVTNSTHETACCLESWLWLYKASSFYCVYPALYVLWADQVLPRCSGLWLKTKGTGQLNINFHAYKMLSWWLELLVCPRVEISSMTQCFFSLITSTGWLTVLYNNLSLSEWTWSYTHWKNVSEIWSRP